MPSKALEVNLAESRVEVTVDPKYDVLKKVMEKYYGIREGLQTFLIELCHPYKNWEFIVQETRSYSLNYFHVLKTHPDGPGAAALYIDTFFKAIDSSVNESVRVDATDNLLLFIQRIIKDAGSDLPRFLSILDHAFDKIRDGQDETFFLFIKSFYQLNKIGKSFMHQTPEGSDYGAINRLLIKYYRHTCDYWLKQNDPLIAFEKESGMAIEDKSLKEIFTPISHQTLKDYQTKLERIAKTSDNSLETILNHLTDFPGYSELTSTYSKIPQKIIRTAGDNGQGNQWKLIFLLQIMNISGLSSIHEEALREINRVLAWLIQHEDMQVIQRSVEKTFAMLRVSTEKFPATTLSCVLNAGRGGYNTDDSDLVNYLIDSVVSLGFQAPEIAGVGNDWQIRVNPAHIQNIRVWLELIELNPKWSKRLISSLIINLSLRGVFIKDTDLFPRDITQLLNSDFGPVYNLVKQLTRLFPSYFNDIGAEGRLRDISTEIDELCQRKDTLVHFLRKQGHVESSNQIIGLIEGTLNFWKTRSKTGVMPFVPPNIYKQIETEGPYIEGVHSVVKTLFDKEKITDITDLLNVGKNDFKDLRALPGVSDQDIRRVELAIDLYRLLFQKYHLGFTEMESYLVRLQSSGLPDLSKLQRALKEKDPEQKLKALLRYLDKLEKVILSSEGYEISEDIYRKRHFTVDIPSMYGSYHEMKFDALGLTFRVESQVNVLFEEIVESFNLRIITRATISDIHEYLQLFDRALRLDGIVSTEMARQLDLLAHALEIRSFSATQYLDIFRGFSQAVNNIVNDYFNNMHQDNLLKILDKLPSKKLLPKYLPQNEEVDRENLTHRVSEIFLRDRIASSLGLQQLDLFLTRILKTLHRQLDNLPKDRLHLLLGSDPQKAVTPFYPAKKGITDIIHLGNKGLNLVRMRNYGLPVPPGFIITTEVFTCREIIDNYTPAKRILKDQISAEIDRLEKNIDKTFGDPRNPLFLSVRSGSSISQPGMMSTFLNVGINEAIVEGIVDLTDNAWFGWDTYRRFLQSYGMAFGLSRDDFDDVIADFKLRASIPYKKDFTGQQMKDVALSYKKLILDNSIRLEESPFEQLYVSIEKVLDSWQSSKAKTYRKIMGISDDWGTAVTVQSMVFGNYSPMSGSGVFFTHNPRWSGDMVVLWGDFTCGNQGEDVVSGLVNTMPISKKQAEIENRAIETSLEVMFPETYHAMREWAKKLVYEKDWSPQEMEFTFEGPDLKDLYFLQTRDMEIRERRKAYSFDFSEEAPIKILEHGIGVSGGAMVGRVVFNLEELRHWRKAEPDTSLIVVRGDTVPDDIKEIYEADGLLTARGGSTSHAAIVAHRLGKTCVVGCSNLICMEKDSSCSLDQNLLKSGEWVSIDGLEGSVYLGKLKIREMEEV